MNLKNDGAACAISGRLMTITRRAALCLALAAALFGCEPDEKKAQGPQPDLTIQPGLGVFFETDQILHFTAVAIGADGKVSPLAEGKGRAGTVGAKQIARPEGSEVRLRFTVAAMPKRGESLEFFRSAEEKFSEIGKTGDVAEILYKDGAKTYAVTAEGHAARAKPKQ